MNRTRMLAVAALTVSVLFWAGNYMLGGVAVAAMPVASLMFLKWAIALIPLLLLTHFIERPNWIAMLRHWKLLLLLSALGILGYGFMFYEALRTTSGFNASLITAFNPALITIGAVLFLRDRITVRSIIGIVIALIGVLWALSGGSFGTLFTQGFNVGDLWMLGVIAVWAAYTLIIRRATQIPPLTSTSLQVLFAVIAMVPLVVVEGIHPPNTSAGIWSLLYIAVFPSIGAYWLYNFGSKTIEPSQAGMFLNLTTVFTAIFSIMAGQSISGAEIIGGILILGGVAMTTRWKSSALVGGQASNCQAGEHPEPAAAEPIDHQKA